MKSAPDESAEAGPAIGAVVGEGPGGAGGEPLAVSEATVPGDFASGTHAAIAASAQLAINPKLRLVVMDFPFPNLRPTASINPRLATPAGAHRRYYTVQFLNGWGETLANINERASADRPSGTFAITLKGAKVSVPATAKKIELPVRYARVLVRVELGSKWDDAVALQKQFTLEAVGKPDLPQLPKTPVFDIEKLPGAEAFEASDAALDPALGGTDLNPGMERLQKNVRTIAASLKGDAAERTRIDGVIKGKALPDFAKAAVLIGHGTLKGGWVRPSTAGVYGDDWLTRSLVDYAGLWANVFDEVIYYKCAVLPSGEALHSDNTYRVTFPKSDLPALYARYFWSVIAVDGVHMRVLPNPLNRFTLSNQSKLTYNGDGSLTLYFGPKKPRDAAEANWLPTLGSQKYRLTFRYYGPKGGVADGSFYPPPLEKLN